jgi:hypothetical protein
MQQHTQTETKEDNVQSCNTNLYHFPITAITFPRYVRIVPPRKHPGLSVPELPATDAETSNLLRNSKASIS